MTTVCKRSSMRTIFPPAIRTFVPKVSDTAVDVIWGRHTVTARRSDRVSDGDQVIGNSIGPLRHPVTMQVRRDVFFARCLRERFRAGHKKSRDSRLFFFAGGPGPLPRYAVRNDDLGAGEPVRLSLNPNQGMVLKTSFE